MNKVSILQSNYIPWKGYFDLINMSDCFVVYDDMQFTKRDWRNRNIIKTTDGPKWLTIPVEVKGKYHQKINETIISDKGWGKTHWTSLKHAYSKSKYFKEYKDAFEKFFLDDSMDTLLTDNNVKLIKIINEIIGIKTEILDSRDFVLKEGKTEKLLGICLDLHATTYLSGPAAKDYLDETLFLNNGINVEWMDYSNYFEYSQLHGEFNHYVTILDLIFNEGPNSIKFMKSFK